MTKKLALSRETLRVLDAENTSEVAGGTITITVLSYRYCGSRNTCASLFSGCNPCISKEA